MRRAILLLLACLAAGAAAEEAPSIPRLPSVVLPPALDRVLRDYEKAWRAHDAGALASLFAEDGFVMGSGQPPVRGREAIRAAYAKAGGPLVLRALAYSTAGRSGYIIGAYGLDGTKDSGKFILALKKAGGRWLIAADMDNSNAPPRPQPAPAPQP